MSFYVLGVPPENLVSLWEQDGPDLRLATRKVLKKIVFKHEFKEEIDGLAPSFLLTEQNFLTESLRINPTQAHTPVHPFSLTLFSTAVTIPNVPESSHLGRWLQPPKVPKDPSLCANPCCQCQKLQYLTDKHASEFSLYPLPIFAQPWVSCSE